MAIAVSTRPKLWSLVIKPAFRPWRPRWWASRKMAVVFPAPRKPPIMTYAALGIFTPLVPALKHSVDRSVQYSNVAVHVHAMGFRRAAGLVEPSFPVGVGLDDCDVLLEVRADARELAGNSAVHVGDGLKPLYQTNDLADFDPVALLDSEAVFYKIAQHPRRELGEANAPHGGLLLHEPVVRGGVQASTAWCSIWVLTMCFLPVRSPCSASPRMARLLLSVAPLVKITSPRDAETTAATCWRAFSTARRARRP